MALNSDSLRCLLIPVGNRHLVLPNSCVAEIITYQEAQPVPDAPNWLLGLLSWRNQMIPTITFETLAYGEQSGVGRRSRLIVMKAFSHRREMPFYAIVTQGFPRLIQLRREELTLIDEESNTPLIQSHVNAAGVKAELPDIDALERMLVARGGTAPS